jgi:hypothetical protein
MSRSQDDPYTSEPAPSMQGGSAATNRPPAIARSSNTHEAPYSNQHTGIGALAENDLLWSGTCLVLGLACVFAVGIWLFRLFSGQIDGSRVVTLCIVLLIYALCAGVGWLWGRYQSAPEQEAQQQQLADLHIQVELLTQRNQSLQQALQKFSASSNLEANRIETAISRPQRVLPASSTPSIYDQQFEPADRSDLPRHPHEKRFPSSTEHNILDYGWQLIGASRRGFSHGYEGKYREDDFQITILRDSTHGPAIALVAIADGVSSKSLSRRGALAAVQGATGLSEEHVVRLKTLLARSDNREEICAAAAGVLLKSLQKAFDSVEQAAHDVMVSVEELQSTLLVFLAAAPGPEHLFLASVQVGDGTIVGLKANLGSDLPPNARWKQLLAPQIQVAGNEVRPFMHSNRTEWRKLIRCDMLNSFACILGMTDGIADDIEPSMPSINDPQPDQFSMVDKFYHLYVAPVLQSPRPADELLKLIGYHKKQSHDDRTLVYLYRH